MLATPPLNLDSLLWSLLLRRSTTGGTHPGPPAIHWLYHLLLQPAADVKAWLGADMPGTSTNSSSRDGASSSSSSSSVDNVVRHVIQHDLAFLRLPVDETEPALRIGRRAAAPQMASDPQLWKELRAAASRALAAYFLLAAATVLHQTDVVVWLLRKLPLLPAGRCIDHCLAAQQRLAWANMTGDLQAPLLLLGALWHAPDALLKVRKQSAGQGHLQSSRWLCGRLLQLQTALCPVLCWGRPPVQCSAVQCTQVLQELSERICGHLGALYCHFSARPPRP